MQGLLENDYIYEKIDDAIDYFMNETKVIE